MKKKLHERVTLLKKKKASSKKKKKIFDRKPQQTLAEEVPCNYNVRLLVRKWPYKLRNEKTTGKYSALD